jgi:uncharacterized protein (TIGR02452 family)
MEKSELISVYQNTKRLCSDISVPLSEKYNFESFVEDWQLLHKGEIIVEPIDTVSAIINYSGQGKIAVLNMANAYNKGGGVEKGSMAQEECLFRCSNLFMIPDEFYPIKKDELIYTHGVSFIKNFYYSTIYPATADVITAAAYNLNPNHSGKETVNMNDYIPYMEKAVNLIVNSAAKNDCDIIILGAWGCGAFKNEPEIVADIFKTVLKEKRYLFNKVIFALINDRNSVGNNFEIFKKAFDEQS